MEKIHEITTSNWAPTIDDLEENLLSNYITWLKFRLKTIYYDLKRKLNISKSEFDTLVKYKNFILVELHVALSLKTEQTSLKR